jgi:hypothetical protein
MKFTVVIVIVTLLAVVFGIFNRRWAIACTFFVLHVAIGSFILGCVSHWASGHQHAASSPYGSHASCNEGVINTSMMTEPKGSRG